MDKQEAIKILKEFHDTSALFSVRTALETVFPELQESEDEKIREMLIRIYKKADMGGEIFGEGITYKQVIAWLEKQGNNLVENGYIQQKDFAPKASTANRQVYNRAILKLLSDYVEKYPDMRFGQMLCNLDVNSHFDQESRETYWNLCKTINKRK